MQRKLLILLGIVGGLVAVWLLVFAIFGKEKATTPTVTLEFWNVFDKSEDWQPLLTAVQNQTGVKINYRSFTDLDEYRDTLLMELAAGEGPDIFAIHESWIPKYANLMRPLPADLSYPAEAVEQEFVDAVASAVVAESIDQQTGEPIRDVLALPMYLDTLAIFYNESLFREVLTKPYPAPAESWSEIVGEVSTLSIPNEDDPEGFTLSGLSAGRADNISRGVELFYQIYQQLGGQDLLSARGESLTDDSGVKYNPASYAIDFLTKFSRNKLYPEYSWNADMTLGSPEKEISDFVRGKLAMLVGYPYYADEIADAIKIYKKDGYKVISADDVFIAPMPQMDLLRRRSFADFFALAVPKNSDQPEFAWQTILQLTSADFARQYLEKVERPSARRDLVAEQQADPELKIFAQQAVFADALPIYDDEKYREIVASTLDAISSGEMTLADGVKNFFTEFEALGKSLGVK